LKVALHSKYYTVGGSALTVERINFCSKIEIREFSVPVLWRNDN
jgi:hypothetical protein